MKKSLIAATALAMFLGALSPVAALAKFPPFSVELEPESPRAGEPITVVVRTWEDVAHTQVADWGIPSPLEDLLALYPAAQVEARAGGLDLTLEETARGEWTAELPALDAGSWVLRAFPDRSGWSDESMPAGYPDEVRFTVSAPGAVARTYIFTGGGATARLIA